MPSHCPLPEGRGARLAHWKSAGRVGNCTEGRCSAVGPPNAPAANGSRCPDANRHGPALPLASPPVRFGGQPPPSNPPAASAESGRVCDLKGSGSTIEAVNLRRFPPIAPGSDHALAACAWQCRRLASPHAHRRISRRLSSGIFTSCRGSRTGQVLCRAQSCVKISQVLDRYLYAMAYT